MVGQTVPPRGRGGGGGQVDRDVCRVEGAVVVEGAVAVQVELQLVLLVGSRRQVKWLLLQLHPGRRKCDRLSWRFLHD